MKHAQIRQAFNKFFVDRGHQEVASSSLIPFQDPTILFTNAGMNQFKDVFLGTDTRPYRRAVSIQKCLRAGGKHNDLENVGFTARHHTFFEMMGNFSFGDYFKKEAIHLAWNFLTQELRIPPERLSVTVFTTDDEAAQIWEKQIGVPAARIFRYGEQDNFWRMGQTGPCGPCSEIFYDHRPSEPPVPLHEDVERYVEIWNLVFMQFFEDETGKQTPLPKPSVDTGAGLERIAAALQGFSDNYQADVFAPLMQAAAAAAGLRYDWQELRKTPELLAALKVCADHARATTFLMAEGVLPANEGRGYVLRRIMRRAIRYGRKLNETQSIFPQVCQKVIDTMAEFYPFLRAEKTAILTGVKDEEKRFLQTLDRGTELLNQHIAELKQQGRQQVAGSMAFTLYDTFGFPVDLTEVIAREHHLVVDMDSFSTHMEKAKDKAKAAAKNYTLTASDRHLTEWTQQLGPQSTTEFVGYETLTSKSSVIGLSTGEATTAKISEQGWFIADRTPFYAEGGGQVGDHGEWQSQNGQGKVINCIKVNDFFLHSCDVTQGFMAMGDQLVLTVDKFSRTETANNHSATHLLHTALRRVLGSHVQQAGSLVTPQKLRFDFSHRQPVSDQELAQVENLVNQQIADDLETTAKVLAHQEAMASGAIAMFGEKYGEKVRVVGIGDFSKELCGGTHVARSSQIRLFKIFSETGVSAGVRRIEAITGRAAQIYLNGLAEENKRIRRVLNVPLPNNFLEGHDDKLTERVQQLQEQQTALARQLETLQTQSVSVTDLLTKAEAKLIKGQKGLALFTQLPIADRKVLSNVVDNLRSSHDNLVVVVIGEGDDSQPLIVAVSKGLKNVHAGEITKELCALMDGKGGGRADFSQGSVTNLSALPQALAKFNELIQ